MATNNKEKILEVKDLVISFKTDRGIVHAVRGVSFDLYKGETLCIVGESGSGKSVTNKAIMGISANNAIIENGQILYEGEDLVRVSEAEFHRIRGKKIGMIFQDPLSALNPVMKIGKQIIEATMVNKNMLKRRLHQQVANELTAYRNNKANTDYNIHQLTNEIANNKLLIEKLKELNKTIDSETNKLEKLKAANVEKNKEKISALTDSIQSNQKSIDEIYASYENYKNDTTKKRSEAIEKYEGRISKLESITSFKNDLERIIRDNNIQKSKLHLAIYQKESFDKFDGTIEEGLTTHNLILKELITSYKAEYKLCKPALKKAYDLSKKAGKKDVKEYKKQITKEHKNKLTSINEELKTAEAEFSSYKASLNPATLKELEEAYNFNKKLDLEEEQKNKKFKEINISKTEKAVDKHKVISDEKFKEFITRIDSIKGKIVTENEEFKSKTKISKAEAKKMAIEVMREVGIPLPEKRFKQYPFEFSGGMRQRIVIAIALTANPEILICDEPTTALDVTIQAQILELINRLKETRNLSCIFITHDLGVVANMADRVAVMYAGKIVEYGLAEEVFFDPKHPYTWALLSAIPDIDSKEKRDAIPGTPPDMIYPPKGDAFALRSKYALAVDFKYEPPYFKISDTHYAATWLLHPAAPKVEMPKIVKTRIENALKEKAKFEKNI